VLAGIDVRPPWRFHETLVDVLAAHSHSIERRRPAAAALAVSKSISLALRVAAGIARSIPTS
jgi:hypothetical protein